MQNTDLHKSIKENYDFVFLYRLIALKLQAMSKYFATSNIVTNSQDISRDILLCSKLFAVFADYKQPLECPYVNFRNVHRFATSKEEEQWFALAPDELRQRKAKNLAFRLLYERSEYWWD